MKEEKTSKFKNLSITLTRAFLLVTNIVLFSVCFSLLFLSFQTHQQFLTNQLKFISEEASNTIQNFIQEKIKKVESISTLSDLATSSKEEQTVILSRLLGKEASFRQLVILYPDEDVLIVSRLSEELSKRVIKYNKTEIFERLKKSDVYLSEVYFDEISREPMMIIGVPILTPLNEFKGVLIAEFNLKFMWELMSKLNISKNGLGYVVNKNGDLLAFKDISRVLKGENLAYLEEVKEFTAVPEPIHKNEIRITKGIMGNTVITDHSHLTNPNWIVVIEIPLIEAYSPILFNLFLSLVFISLGIVLSFFMGKHLSYKITSPIMKLRDAAIEVGKGNLDVEIRIESNDEIGELSETFSQMVKEIKSSRIKLEEYSKNLEKQVQERTKELEEKVKELTETKLALLNIAEDLEATNKELLKAQAELKKSYEELKKLDLEKDRFISIAAHELKTPMTAISGFAQLLKNEAIINDKEKRVKYLKIIEDEIKRLSTLVTDVLDLSRIDLGTMKVSIEEANVKEILNEIKESMGELAKQKGLYLEIKVDEKIPNIFTDVEKLKRILINLVSNSIKYTEKGGITVEAVKEGEYVRFCVIDTGIGIPKEHFDKIFTRFYQVASPYTRKVGGSGLGLSICKELVELLGGKIWFESEVGKGSKFYFTLPIKYKGGKKQ
ncbi:MAG: ATP-binding protein [Candidatus Aenigmatarchaeota archaeon]